VLSRDGARFVSKKTPRTILSFSVMRPEWLKALTQRPEIGARQKRI